MENQLAKLALAIGRECAQQEFRWMKHSRRPNLSGMLDRRIAGEPLQYILGQSGPPPIPALIPFQVPPHLAPSTSLLVHPPSFPAQKQRTGHSVSHAHARPHTRVLFASSTSAQALAASPSYYVISGHPTASVQSAWTSPQTRFGLQPTTAPDHPSETSSHRTWAIYTTPTSSIVSTPSPPLTSSPPTRPTSPSTNTTPSPPPSKTTKTPVRSSATQTVSPFTAPSPLSSPAKASSRHTPLSHSKSDMTRRTLSRVSSGTHSVYNSVRWRSGRIRGTRIASCLGASHDSCAAGDRINIT